MSQISERLFRDYQEIVAYLKDLNYSFQDLPTTTDAIKSEGEAYSISYPIQGILKYHGFADSNNRISYFPSISFNNDCVYTISYLKFDSSFEEDNAILNGKIVNGDDLERITFALDFIRKYANIDNKASLISRNFFNVKEHEAIGKGLGTSASGSSALGIAAASILYNNEPEYLNNYRLISIFSRYLSGSGCRSATGGLSLWLSHPEINPLDSYAIRLDKEEHNSFMNQIELITIPIQSELKTPEAHKYAPTSPFFERWLKLRKKFIIKFIDALNEENLNKIGELAEFGTFNLHAVSLTASKPIIAWEYQTIEMMRFIQKLRKNKKYCVYFSIDTGPSVVLLVHISDVSKVLTELKAKFSKLTFLKGKIGSSARILSLDSPEINKLKVDLKVYREN
ncbi:MAG: diphosphomevalonate/mevalonate 3,5-bisphosphate decarboxylase family protein [Promethearchaeota archaeon]